MLVITIGILKLRSTWNLIPKYFPKSSKTKIKATILFFQSLTTEYIFVFWPFCVVLYLFQLAPYEVEFAFLPLFLSATIFEIVDCSHRVNTDVYDFGFEKIYEYTLYMYVRFKWQYTIYIKNAKNWVVMYKYTFALKIAKKLLKKAQIYKKTAIFWTKKSKTYSIEKTKIPWSCRAFPVSKSETKTDLTQWICLVSVGF